MPETRNDEGRRVTRNGPATTRRTVQPNCNPHERPASSPTVDGGRVEREASAGQGDRPVVTVIAGQGCRLAHNPKVAGSNPAPATKKALVSHYGGPGLRRSPARLLTELLTDVARSLCRGLIVRSQFTPQCCVVWLSCSSSFMCAPPRVPTRNRRPAGPDVEWRGRAARPHPARPRAEALAPSTLEVAK